MLIPIWIFVFQWLMTSSDQSDVCDVVFRDEACSAFVCRLEPTRFHGWTHCKHETQKPTNDMSSHMMTGWIHWKTFLSLNENKTEVHVLMSLAPHWILKIWLWFLAALLGRTNRSVQLLNLTFSRWLFQGGALSSFCLPLAFITALNYCDAPYVGLDQLTSCF